jgi:hypothetical protein
VFSLRRESTNMILGDKPLISEVVLSQPPLESNFNTGLWVGSIVARQ